MKRAPNLRANENGCIFEKDILRALPEELIPLWENYMRGKTVIGMSISICAGHSVLRIW